MTALLAVSLVPSTGLGEEPGLGISETEKWESGERPATDWYGFSGATGGEVAKWVSPEDFVKQMLEGLKIFLNGKSTPSVESQASDMPPSLAESKYNNLGKVGGARTGYPKASTQGSTAGSGAGAAAGTAGGSPPVPSPLPPSALRRSAVERFFQTPIGVPTADVAVRTGSDPVAPGWGELVESRTDLKVPGVGMDFELTRTYRSRWDYKGPLGGGWDHSFNQRLEVVTASCTGETRRFWMTGHASVLEWSQGAEGYRSIPESNYRLNEEPSGGWTLRHPDGRRSYFNVDGLLERISDLAGNSLEVSWEPAPDLQGDTRALP